MDKNLERLMYLFSLKVFQPLEQHQQKEYDELKFKLNEKLEKGEYCQEHHKIYETRCAPEKKRPTLKEQELEQQIKQLKEENQLIKNEMIEKYEKLDNLEDEIQSLKSQLPTEANDNNGIIKYKDSFYLMSNASDLETAEDDYSAFQDITLLHLQGETIQKIKESKSKVEYKNEKLQKVIDEIRELHANILSDEPAILDILNELKTILDKIEVEK